ncbi:MAG: putative DNA binding domain-containing protein [Candidatus Omnitrophica bacterium]|nr:putative DNA binding domain-containing protein [Candidatus Omnitrophota bacterium]
MNTEKPWIQKARQLYRQSLHPVPHELNELDWKMALSEDKHRIAEHLCAFANHPGGAFFLFGVNSDGKSCGLDQDTTHEIIKKIGNLARQAVEPSQAIDHFIDQDPQTGDTILFVHISESSQKPVHLRGKGVEYSFIRSGGQTRKMSKQEIVSVVLTSKTLRYEDLEALRCGESDILELLDHEVFFQLLGIPSLAGMEKEATIEQLVNQKLIYRNGGEISISNLGVITAAHNFDLFPGKERFSVRVIHYRGVSRIETENEKEFKRGYGTGFQEIIRYVLGQLPTSEVIQDALRRNAPVYPEITIRELVANALIHRDFLMTGMNPMIEIFSDRMEITNPGTLLPSIRLERLIDMAPESRNESFAALMRRLGICEERGSGIDKALFAVEVYGLPPVKFVNGPNAFKAILYSPKTFKQMSPDERLEACLQHCCISYYVAQKPMTNASFRKRLGLKDGQYVTAWRIIDTALEKKWIKPRDSKKGSRKYAAYIPFWA